MSVSSEAFIIHAMFDPIGLVVYLCRATLHFTSLNTSQRKKCPRSSSRDHFCLLFPLTLHRRTSELLLLFVCNCPLQLVLTSSQSLALRQKSYPLNVNDPAYVSLFYFFFLFLSLCPLENIYWNLQGSTGFIKELENASQSPRKN